MLYVATMKTDHYTFEGAGSTPEKAKKVLVDGFRKHLRKSIAYWKNRAVEVGSMQEGLQMAFSDLDAHYGVWVRKFDDGTFLRDGEEL